MNKSIQTLAEEAGLHCDGTPDAWDLEAIERFAALVAAHEREACAKDCEALSGMTEKNPNSASEKAAVMAISLVAEIFAEVIRSRGQHEKP